MCTLHIASSIKGSSILSPTERLRPARTLMEGLHLNPGRGSLDHTSPFERYRYHCNWVNHYQGRWVITRSSTQFHISSFSLLYATPRHSPTRNQSSSRPSPPSIASTNPNLLATSFATALAPIALISMAETLASIALT